MNRTKHHLWVLVLVLILLAIPTAAVLAKELSSLTITGPGIDGEMSIDHEGGMLKLERTGFFDQILAIKPPENLGAGYDITAYLNLDGTIVPFVQMVYYASDGDQPGYVHYTARLAGESLQPVNQWRQLNKDADTAFRGLMDEYKIALQPAFTVKAEAVAAVKPASEAAVSAAKEPISEPAAVQPETDNAQTPARTPIVSTLPNQVLLAVAALLLVLLGAGPMIRRRATSQRSPQV